MCFAPQRRALVSTSEPPKVARTCSVLYILTSKCASRHNGVHFFDISTSKSAPSTRCFVHFDLEMCFEPQRRALFRHLNFQKWSEHQVFCTFWLANVHFATAVCDFSTSELQKMVRTSGVLYILTCTCASRHSRVPLLDIVTSNIAPNPSAFFAFRLGNVLRATTACNFSSLLWPCSWVRTRCFSEPTFRPSGATNHSSDSFSSLIFSLLLSSSLCLCPALLFICPYCRKFDF